MPMRRMAGLPKDNRSELFSQVASKLGMTEAVVEKDFWVCFVLDYLFTDSPYSTSMVFKGGTSLSKAFSLINRFSEDIDLILDWRLIGYGRDEPWEERSKTKQVKFNKESVERTTQFLNESFIPVIKEGLSEILGDEAKLSMSIDGQTVLFAYPCAFSSPATLDHIRLEIGPLAAWTPYQQVRINSYAAQAYPEAFHRPDTIVCTAKPERTFWEKATILHQEFYRPEEKPLPSRHARHYYDVYMLGHSRVLESSLADSDLLTKVRDFKVRFYPSSWARYDLADIGTLRLKPRDERCGELERDYKNMSDMFLGSIPSFNSLVSYMEELEERIHAGH